jgi:hypothetical protein
MATLGSLFLERTFVHNLAYSAFALACGLLTGIGVYMSGGPYYCPFIFAGLFGFSFLGLLVTWQPEPRYPAIRHLRSYELDTILNEGRTLKRSTLRMGHDDWMELRQIARRIGAGERFNKAVPNYYKWRALLIEDGWMTFDRNKPKEGVDITRRGYQLFRELAKPLPHLREVSK